MLLCCVAGFRRLFPICSHLAHLVFSHADSNLMRILNCKARSLCENRRNKNFQCSNGDKVHTLGFNKVFNYKRFRVIAGQMQELGVRVSNG